MLRTRFWPGLLAAATLLTLSTTANAQSIVTYDFAGEPGNQLSTPGTAVAPGVTATDITRGPGLTTNAGTNSINSANWSSTFDATDYYTFSVTAPAGQFFNFTTLNFNTQRSNTGPQTLELRSSLDGFAASIATLTSLPTVATAQSIDLSGLDASSAVATPVEFRFFGYNGTSAAGTLRLTNIGATPGVVLNGVPVPEPATLLAAGVGVLGLGGLVRRRVVG